MDLLESEYVNALKLPLKERNQLIDAVFYDVDALTGEERAGLTPWVDRKGTIIVVSPRNALRKGKIRHYPNALRFLIMEGNSVQAIAVAGVGSSVLGTAALARNVADHYGVDVAGIVTGYGVADAAVEGLGGWFFYGEIDRLKYEMERTVARMGSLPPGSQFGPLPSPLYTLVPGNLDVTALHDILLAKFLPHVLKNLRLIVGHSKGNLLISFVLNHMAEELRTDKGGVIHEPFDNLTVVTLGTVVDIPDALIRPEHVYQFMGQFDLLGAANSDRFEGQIKPYTEVPGAGHHLNPKLPFAIPLADILGGVPLVRL